jgi:hypothetical protein
MQCANPSENNNAHVFYLFPGSIISRHQIQIGLGAFSENALNPRKLWGYFFGEISLCVPQPFKVLIKSH